MLLIPSDYWEVKQTQRKGRGVFARQPIDPGTILGDYIGMVVRTADIDIDEATDGLYLTYYSDEASILPDKETIGIHLLNHSCNPNAWLYTFHGHTLAFALRHIFSGEEITTSYLLSPKYGLCNPCIHACYCESFLCTKTMHLSLEKYTAWRKFQDTQLKKDKRASIRYGKQLKPLGIYPKIILDDPIYDLYGALDESPEIYKGYIVPSQRILREILRKTGKTIDIPAVHKRILGIAGDRTVSVAI